MTSYGYDTFGDKVITEDPDGNETFTAYNGNGQPTTGHRPVLYAAEWLGHDHTRHDDGVQQPRRGGKPEGLAQQHNDLLL